MGDVAAGHEQPVIADAGDAAALGAGVRGDIFADAVALADFQPGAFAPNFRSCGTSPIEAKGKTMVSSPITVSPVTTTWDFSTTSRPSSTCGPTTPDGPISQPAPIRAAGSTTAEG